MLSYETISDFEGITLSGSYLVLRQLHEVLHEVNEQSQMSIDKEAGLLTFAYDVRKAYEGQRHVIAPQEGRPEIGVRFGVNLLWPQILVYSRILRSALAYMDSKALHQAYAFALEAILEDALDEVFADNAREAKTAWKMIDPAHPGVEEKLESRAAAFYSWNAERRRTSLAQLLISLHPLYESSGMWKSAGKHLHPDKLAAAKFSPL